MTGYTDRLYWIFYHFILVNSNLFNFILTLLTSDKKDKSMNQKLPETSGWKKTKDDGPVPVLDFFGDILWIIRVGQCRGTINIRREHRTHYNYTVTGSALVQSKCFRNPALSYLAHGLLLKVDSTLNRPGGSQRERWRLWLTSRSVNNGSIQ